MAEYEVGQKVRHKLLGIERTIERVDSDGFVWVPTFGFLNGYPASRFEDSYELVGPSRGNPSTRENDD